MALLHCDDGNTLIPEHPAVKNLVSQPLHAWITELVLLHFQLR